MSVCAIAARAHGDPQYTVICLVALGVAALFFVDGHTCGQGSFLRWLKISEERSGNSIQANVVEMNDCVRFEQTAGGIPQE